MKVTCLQENLARGLQITGRAVSTRGSLPILGNVLLRTEGGRLKLTATNLEVGINCWVPAKVDDDGAITVPAKLFTDFVNSLPAGPTELSLNVRTKTVHLRRDPYEANFKGMDAEEFPIIPVAPDKPTTRVSKSTLRRMIGEVAFVATTDDSRPVLTGVLTTLEGDKITMAAADPYRLSVRNAKLMDKVEGKLEVIIPARSLQEVQRIIDDSDDPVDIFVTPNGSQVIFHTPEADLVSRIIEGQFPNYRQVIPQGKPATRITVQREELLQATRLASLFARDSANMLRFQVNPSDQPPLIISANAAEVGDQTAEGGRDRRGTEHHDRLQLALRVRRAQQPHRTRGGARARRPARARRHQDRRRSGLPPRGDAASHSGLDGARLDPRARGLPQLRAGRAAARARRCGIRRAERRRQDESPGGDPSHRARRLAACSRRHRDGPLGRHDRAGSHRGRTRRRPSTHRDAALRAARGRAPPAAALSSRRGGEALGRRRRRARRRRFLSRGCGAARGSAERTASLPRRDARTDRSRPPTRDARASAGPRAAQRAPARGA